MLKTIILISAGSEGPLVSVQSPIKLSEIRQLPLILASDASPPANVAGAVLAYGRMLFQSLCQSHAGIKEAMQHVLTTRDPDQHAILFKISETTDERIYWETTAPLDGSFLALDARWPMGRIAERGDSRELSRREVRLPLVVLAVISAFPFSAENEAEWKGLRDAAADAHANGFDVTLVVWIGEIELRDRIQAEAIKFVTAEIIPKSELEFEERFRKCNPHVVHLFCHGEVTSGLRMLRFATANDWTAASGVQNVKPGDEIMPLKITIEKLIAIFARHNNILLATLNCCRGGQSTAELHSMAHDLVINGLIPAAIGMLEPVDAGDANAFCKNLYSAVFEALREIKTAAAHNGAAELAWCRALRGPRASIYERHGQQPDSIRGWAVPVLYLHSSPLTLEFNDAFELTAEQRAQLTDEQSGRLKVVVEMLRKRFVPDSKRQAFLDLLDDLPAHLRPNAEGQFTS